MDQTFTMRKEKVKKENENANRKGRFTENAYGMIQMPNMNTDLTQLISCPTLANATMFEICS